MCNQAISTPHLHGFDKAAHWFHIILAFPLWDLETNGYPYEPSETNMLLFNKFLGIISWYCTYPLSLFEFFTLFAALLLFLTLGSDAIPMAYQINAR